MMEDMREIEKSMDRLMAIVLESNLETRKEVGKIKFPAKIINVLWLKKKVDKLYEHLKLREVKGGVVKVNGDWRAEKKRGTRAKLD